MLLYRDDAGVEQEDYTGGREKTFLFPLAPTVTKQSPLTFCYLLLPERSWMLNHPLVEQVN